MILAFLLLLAGFVFDKQPSPVTARLRGVTAPSDRVAWASGANGTIVRTADGGATWQRQSIAGAERLDFRDIDAVDPRTAYALSIGPGEASRIYKTSDAGATWALQFTNRDERAFFDAMAFSSARRGFAFSDSVDGRFVMIHTRDGQHWEPVGGLPPARPGEGAFAASGTNVAVYGRRHVWVGTSFGRVLRSEDDGRTWTIAETGMASAETAGLFSLAFRDARHGVAVGGDFKQEDLARENAAWTNDGGRTWQAAKGLTGFRSVVAHLSARRWLAIGPNGADLSEDDGRTWRRVSGDGFHAFHRRWAVGEGGRIARLRP